MKGIIKNYNSDKGYGFISGDNGDVFFHISSLKDKGIILSTGMGVTYSQGTNEKGEYAFDIKVVEAVKPIFIKFGSDRIKLSNIKNYGISDGSSEILTNLKRNEDDLEQAEELLKIFGQAPQRQAVRNLKESILEQKKSKKYQSAKTGETPYLFITTYQGDNYRYYECECDWNIYEKLEQLDKYLCE